MALTNEELDVTLDTAWSPLFDDLRARKGTASTERLIHAVNGIRYPTLMAYLRWRYPEEPLLERGGCVYPVSVHPASDEQRDVDTVLGREPSSVPGKVDTAIFADTEYRTTITNFDMLAQPPTTNALTFSMETLSIAERLALSCQPGQYFASLDSCESLEWELRLAARDLPSDPSAFAAFEKAHLPKRSALHSLVESPARDGSRRCAAVGIATAIAFFDGTRYSLLMRRRGQKGQPLRIFCLHVLPSFMFQAITNDSWCEFKVSHNIFREYLEELYDCPTAETDDHNVIYADERVKYLQKLLAEGGAELRLTGVAVNLLNLRPEICALLVIHTPEWYERGNGTDAGTQKDAKWRWRINAEFAAANDPLMAVHLRNQRVRLLADDAEMVRQNLIVPPLTVPAGAAAFWLAVDSLRRDGRVAARLSEAQ